MAPPKEISFDDIMPTGASKADTPVPPIAEPAALSADQVVYANRFVQQKYHPVVLIGSAAAGKTVMLLSLLAYFKNNAVGNNLSAFFGDDLFSAAESTLRDQADRYFERTVSDYVRGTTDAATKIGKPLFIPARVCGQSGTEAKFAFMESDGEWYQPDRSPNAQAFIAPFKPELEALLKQYPDGISFLWVAPHMSASAPGSGLATDADELMRQANESLSGAFQNYETLRRHNSARDTHMFIVTKWDTFVSETSPADIRVSLDRARDGEICHEVDNFIARIYAGPYGRFQAINSPLENKIVFRYSAGLFNDRSRGSGVGEETLNTYPRDVWNWLYEGALKGHDWDLPARPLISKPIPAPPTLLQRIFKAIGTVLD